jgi:3'-phosphoadenosine 5'-phosphosulfate sulfotransferase (PAPS reductase)/FAD synthetase
MKHIGAISGGKDSTAMALRLSELYPEISFEWVCTPTGNEPAEWFAHMRHLRERIGDIHPAMYPGGLDALIRQWNALPNWRQRWCTRVLKIETFAAYLMKNSPAKFYVGLRADEERREGGDYLNVPNVEMVFPMREWHWGLDDVLAYLKKRGQTVPKRTDCRLCFFQRLIEWFELWRDDPDGFSEGERYEYQTGFTFRSPGRDTWPAALKDLRAEFENGRIPKDTRRDAINEMQCRVCRL